MTMDKQLKRVALVGLGLLVVLMININYIQGSQAEKLQTNKLNSRQYQDVFLSDRGDILAADGKTVLAFSDPVDNSTKPKYQRKYISAQADDGKVFAPVTGFFAGNGQKTGLELAYNSLLDGKDKNKQSVTGWLDQLAGKKPVGANIISTIDPEAQRVAYQKLQVTTRRAAAVVIDIKTGALKVAASFPSFDPNSVASIKNSKTDTENFAALQANKLSPLTNNAFRELFPPGSSFKTVVAASALENGFTKDTGVPAPFMEPIPGSTRQVSNDEGGVCSQTSSPLIETFAASCNTTFAILGSRDSLLGNTKVAATARKFGFYKTIPIEDQVVAVPSVYPTGNDGAAAFFLGSFGQGETKTTPLQMALVAEAIANKGTIMKPYLVDKVKSRDGNELQSTDHEVLSKPISSESASQLEDMMRAVVDHGTAASTLKGQNIAGKTGTAELDGNRRGLWFVGFAPADDPKYAFAVSIEGTKGDFGASKSGPVALAIVNALLKK